MLSGDGNPGCIISRKPGNYSMHLSSWDASGPLPGPGRSAQAVAFVLFFIGALPPWRRGAMPHLAYGSSGKSTTRSYQG